MGEQRDGIVLVQTGLEQAGLEQTGKEQAVAVVSRAIDYFARWYASPIDIPAMAGSLGVSLETLEGSFERFRGRTTHEALIQFRLNRLCDAISANPGGLLTAQAEACGFPRRSSWRDLAGASLPELPGRDGPDEAATWGRG